jgi:hypothetical protein
LKELLLALAVNAGQEKENPVVISVGTAKDKQAIQNVSPVIPEGKLDYQVQEGRGARLPYQEDHIGGSSF